MSSDVSEVTDELDSFSMIRPSELGTNLTVTFTFCDNEACCVKSEADRFATVEHVTEIPGAVSIFAGESTGTLSLSSSVLSPTLFLKVKPTVMLPDGLVTVGDGAEGSTSVTRNREVDVDGKNREGDDDRDGGVTGDEEELGE